MIHPARRVVLACMAALFPALAGCGPCRYYQITDPATGRVYYTRSGPIVTETCGLWRYDSGAVRFTDIPSGADVTLGASEIREVAPADVPARPHPTTRPH